MAQRAAKSIHGANSQAVSKTGDSAPVENAVSSLRAELQPHLRQARIAIAKEAPQLSAEIMNDVIDEVTHEIAAEKQREGQKLAAAIEARLQTEILPAKAAYTQH